MGLLAYDLLHASIAFRGPIEAVPGEGTSPSGPSGWRCLTSTIFVDAIDTVRRKCCCPVRTGSLAGAARAGLPGSPGGCSAAPWLGRFVARACRLGLVRRGRSCPASSRSVSEGVLGYADAEACLPGSAAEGEGDVGVFGRRVVPWEQRRFLDGYQDSAGCVGECVSGGDKGNRPRTRSHSPRSMDRCVQAELDRDPERLGVAILIKIDKIAELSGEVLQQRD